jgi:hypothetical protein
MVDNFEIAFAYLNQAPIEEVLVGLPLRPQYIKKIFQSEYVYEFLVKIGENKDKLINNFREDEGRFTNTNHKFDIHAEPKGEREGEYNSYDENNYDEEENTPYIDTYDRGVYVYAYYQFDNVLPKQGTEIHPINYMFWGGRYFPDQLVKVLTLDQIKHLNSLGYVIGKFIHVDSPYSYDGDREWITPECDNFKNNHRGHMTKINRVNATKRETYSTTLVDRGEKTFFALKYALNMYKFTGGENEDMVEYLTNLLIERKQEINLFVPEVIWVLSQYLPPTHKLIKAFLPDLQAYKDHVLFDADPEVIPIVGESAYKMYYPIEIRPSMLITMADIIVSNKEAFEETLSRLEQVSFQEQTTLFRNDNDCAKIYHGLFKATFRMSLGKSVQQRIIKSLSGKENPDIVKETYQVDAYDSRNQIRLFALFYKLVSARNKELIEELRANAPPEDEEEMGGGGGGGGDY